MTKRREQNGNGHEALNGRQTAHVSSSTSDKNATGDDCKEKGKSATGIINLGTKEEASGYVLDCDNDGSSDSSDDYPGRRRPPTPATARMITLRLKFGDKQENVVVASHRRLRKVLRAFSDRHLPPGRSAKFLAAGQVAFLNWTNTPTQARLRDDHVIKLLDMPAKSPVPEVAPPVGASSAATATEGGPTPASTAPNEGAAKLVVYSGQATKDLEPAAGATATTGITTVPAGGVDAKPAVSRPAVPSAGGEAKPKVDGGKAKVDSQEPKKTGAPAANAQGRKLGVDYSKWDRLHLSDDDDDDDGEHGSGERGRQPTATGVRDERSSDDLEECVCHNTDCSAYECCLNREVKKVLDETKDRQQKARLKKVPITPASASDRTCKNLMECGCESCCSVRAEALTKLLSKRDSILEGHMRLPATILLKHVLKRYTSAAVLYLRAHGLSGTWSRDNRLVQLEAVHFTKLEALRRKKTMYFDSFCGFNPKGEPHGTRCACRACTLAEMCVHLSECIRHKSREEQVKFFEATLKQLTDKDKDKGPKVKETKGQTKGIDYSKWDQMALETEDSSEDEDGKGAVFSAPSTHGLLDAFMSIMCGAEPPPVSALKGMYPGSYRPVCTNPDCQCRLFNDRSPYGSRPSTPPPFPKPTPKPDKQMAPKPSAAPKGGKGGASSVPAEDMVQLDLRNSSTNTAGRLTVPVEGSTLYKFTGGGMEELRPPMWGEGPEKKGGKKKKKGKKEEDGKEGEKAKEKETSKEKEQAKAWVPRQCKACQTVESRPKQWLICSSCYNVHYCSTDCQRRDWKAHKPACIQAAKQKKATK